MLNKPCRNDTPQGLPFSLDALVDQDGHPLVDPARDLGVAAAAEDRAGAGVGVEPCEVLGAKGEVPLLLLQIGYLTREEHQVQNDRLQSAFERE